MNFKELLESWRTSAAAPRTVRSWSVRLPVEDAARLEALAELFPGRSSEQLITELMAVALREVAAAMPYVAGERVISTDDHGDPVYEDVGPTPRFMELARRHRRTLEAAAGADRPPAPKPARQPKTKAARPKPRRSR